MKALLVAIGFLTRIPVPRITADATDFARAIRFYPVAGLLVGAMVALAGSLGAYLDPWIAALAALVAWVAVTGALHLDGLGDLADGLGAAHGDRSRLLAVMADPHIGSFGVVAIVLQMAGKLVLLHALASGNWGAIVAVPFAARIGPIAWARLVPPLKPGLGADVAAAARPSDLLGWAAVLAGVAALVPAMLFAAPLILGWTLWLRRRLGGVSGDAHGAGIELVETGLLLALAVVRAG